MLKCAPSGLQFVQARGSEATLREIRYKTTIDSKSKSQHDVHNLKYRIETVRTYTASTSPIQCIGYNFGQPVELVALGHQDGSVLVHPTTGEETMPLRIPARQQRSCTSVKLNDANLLAIGLDKVRNDSSLVLYDIESQSPFSMFAYSEGVSSLAWCQDDPHCVLAGLNYRWLRVVDIRMDPRDVSAFLSIPTKAVYEIAVDINDANCFASTYDNNVLVWDRRRSDAVALCLKASTGKEGSRVNELRFRPDRRSHLAGMSDDGTFDLWDLHETNASDQSYRVHKHNIRTFPFVEVPSRLTGVGADSKLVAFDFVRLPHQFANAWNAVVLPKSNDNAELRTVDTSIPSIGFTSLNDFVLSDQGRASISKSSCRSEVCGQIIHSSTKDNEHESDKLDSDVDDSEDESEKPRPLLSRQLSTTHSSGGAKEYDDEQSEVEESLGGHEESIRDSMFHDISSTMYSLARQGYGLDSMTNRTLVAGSSSSLRTIWTWLAWTTKASSEGKLHSRHFDFTFEGCLNIWNGLDDEPRADGTFSDEFYDAVDAVNSNFPNDIFPSSITQAPMRQLALTSIGWCLTTAEFNSFQSDLIRDGRHDMAAFYAVTQDRDIRMATRILEDSDCQMEIAISEYLASRGNDEAQRRWRDSCSDWRVDLDSPYIRAIFAYLQASDWKDVIDEQGLALRERVALAIRYIDDEQLTFILRDLCRTEVAEGGLEGLLLTGINIKSLDLLQVYVDRTADVQTAALIASLRPDLSSDDRVLRWVGDYRFLLQSWSLHIARCRFDVGRTRLLHQARISGVPPAQVSIRCNHCNSVIARPPARSTWINAKKAQDTKDGLQQGRASATGQTKATTCGNCRKPLPKCVLCLLQIGNERVTAFCLTCNHTMHSGHADHWFQKHDRCPAPACSCKCRSIQSIGPIV